MIRQGIERGFGRGFEELGGGRGGFGPGRFPGPGPFPAAAGLGFALIFVAFWVLVVVAFWQLYKKAGYEGGMSLLMLIPLVNIGALIFLAFSDWPVLQRLREAVPAEAVQVEEKPSEDTASEGKSSEKEIPEDTTD